MPEITNFLDDQPTPKYRQLYTEKHMTMNYFPIQSREFSALKYLLTAAVAVTFASTAGAVENTAVATGDWNTASTWSGSLIPAASGTVYVSGSNTVSYTSGVSPSLTRLYIGDSATGQSPAVGTVTVSGGTLVANANAVGVYVIGRSAGSTGTLNVSGGFVRGIGSNAGNGMQVGFGTNSTGAVNVSSGSLALSASIQLGVANGSVGTMLISGGNVTVSTGTNQALFYVGGRLSGATTTGTLTQTAGVLTVSGSTNLLGVGYSGSSTHDIRGVASFTGGTFTGNVRVGRDSAVTSGGGTGTLTIGSASHMSGTNQAWELSATGEIIFKLGTDATFNAVNLAGATGNAFDITQAGAKITIDGSSLVFSSSYAPITLMSYLSGHAVTGTSNAVYSFIGFDPQFATPTLNWAPTGLQLTLGAVPEPSTVALLLGAGAVGVLVVRRRRQRHDSASS